MNQRLGRGVNLGNALEGPSEGEWGVVLREEYFARIQEAGFDSVRIPICWSAHAATTAPYTIDSAFLERVDWAVDQALSRRLLAIINVHHYDELMEQPIEHRERFLALWKQIASHYQDYPDELVFEILNEPHGALTAARWNDLLVEALGVIRETNPERTVIVGTADWGGVGGLGRLKLPADDPHLIVTVHYYDPFEFTHQGTEWAEGSARWLGTTWEATPAQQRAIRADLDIAGAWAEKHGVPMFLGEFGAYSRAAMDSRVRWTEFVAREAEARGFSWAYWEFCAGFGAYDPVRAEWRQGLLQALIPPQP